MSYAIYIGQARPSEGEERGMCAEWVDRVEAPDAPTFPHDERTGRSNGRHPSYMGWSAFVEEAGLYDLFFDEQAGLMRAHPGTQRLTTQHGAVIACALASWLSAHPGAVPGLGEDRYDTILARLIWLCFWVHRALQGPAPAIHNH